MLTSLFHIGYESAKALSPFMEFDFMFEHRHMGRQLEEVIVPEPDSIGWRALEQSDVFFSHRRAEIVECLLKDLWHKQNGWTLVEPLVRVGGELRASLDVNGEGEKDEHIHCPGSMNICRRRSCSSQPQ